MTDHRVAVRCDSKEHQMGMYLMLLEAGYAVECRPEPSIRDQTVTFGGATAMVRSSSPLRFWKKQGFLSNEDGSDMDVRKVLDFGCGQEEHAFVKYDACTHPDVAPLLRRYDRVMCNFVLNVQPATHLVDQIAVLLRSLVRQDGKALIAIRDDHRETTNSVRGHQLKLPADDWHSRLLKVFGNVERVNETDWIGFVCRRKA